MSLLLRVLQDLLCEGRYASKMQERPATGSMMVSYVWGLFQFGALVAALLVGPLADQALPVLPVLLYWHKFLCKVVLLHWHNTLLAPELCDRNPRDTYIPTRRIQSTCSGSACRSPQVSSSPQRGAISETR